MNVDFHITRGREKLENSYAIEMLHITKRFPGIVANDDITLQLRKGEIHALLGENGAGKSTLMSVLFGLYQAEEGVIKKDGREVQIKDPNDANALGIGMVHQHFKLVECFSVLDNIIMGVEPCKLGFLQKKDAREARAGAVGEIRPARRSGRAGGGHHRGHAAAHGDSEDAVPRKRNPDLRRAHRRAHAAGNRRADAHHAQPGRRGQEHSVHIPQAERNHGCGRPLHRAAQGQVHRHGEHRRHHRARSFPA